MIFMAGSGVAGLAIIGNVIFLAVCLYRRRKKNEDGDGGQTDTSGEDGGGEDGNAEMDLEDPGKAIEAFLDSQFTPGMDDSPDLEVNPVMLFRIEAGKKRAASAKANRRASRMSVCGGGAKTGQPGALSKLGWSMAAAAAAGADRAKQVKTVEAYLQRAEDVDVRKKAAKRLTVAGKSSMNVYMVAEATGKKQVARIGGRRASCMAGAAHMSRMQLAELAKKGKAGSTCMPTPSALPEPDDEGEEGGEGDEEAGEEEP